VVVTALRGRTRTAEAVEPALDEDIAVDAEPEAEAA
jgi:hypothetical protein